MEFLFLEGALCSCCGRGGCLCRSKMAPRPVQLCHARHWSRPFQRSTRVEICIIVFIEPQIHTCCRMYRSATTHSDKPNRRNFRVRILE